jgi:D-3-phosphoglycerate dehydrogenase
MRVLITDHVHPILADTLRSKGHTVDVQPDITHSEVMSIIQMYEGLVVSTKTLVDAPLIDKGTRLRFIARAGSGMEHIDSVYAKKAGILVVSSPEGNANAVAEHALGLLLGLVRHIPLANEQVQQEGLWIREANRGIELSGRTIGVIGYGNTGSAFVHKLKGLDMNILVYDKYKSGYGEDFFHESDMSALYAKAEIISLHLPLTPETHQYISASFIECMQNPFYLINTSRGNHVHLDAALTGIQTGKMIGMALDVLPNEMLPSFSLAERNIFQKLCSYKGKVIISPHIAGWTGESKLRLATVLLDKLAAIIGEA